MRWRWVSISTVFRFILLSGFPVDLVSEAGRFVTDFRVDLGFRPRQRSPEVLS